MTARDSARISIFVPVWNGGPWLRGALDSVLGQTSGAWELVIGDNASTDETAGIARSIVDPRVRHVRWEEHAGIFENFNRTWAECATEWAYILPADDRLRPRFVERVLATIDGDRGRRGLAMVTTAASPVDPEGRPIGGRYFGYQGVRAVAEGTYDATGWLRVCTHPGAAPWTSGAYRRAVVERMGGFYRTDVPSMSADLEIAFRAAAYGDVAYIADALVDVTSWPESHTHGRIGFNMASREPFTPQGRALVDGLIAHEAQRIVSATERELVRAAVARTFLRRATSQRTFAEGRGRRGALEDVVHAARLSPQTVVRRLPLALALVAAPVQLLQASRSSAIGHRELRHRASAPAPPSAGRRPGTE